MRQVVQNSGELENDDEAKDLLLRRLSDALKLLCKSARTIEEYQANQVILTALAPESEGLVKKFAKILKIRPRSLRQYVDRRSMLDNDEHGAVWFEDHKATYKNSFMELHKNDGVIDTIIDFQVDNTQASSNTSDVKTNHVKTPNAHKKADGDLVCPTDPETGKCLCEDHATHYLLMTRRMFYDLFCQKKQDLADVVSYTMFISFMPYFISSPTIRTCTCRYHQEMQMFNEAYRRMSRKWHGECTCLCGFCESNSCQDHPNKTTFTMMQHSLCKPEECDDNQNYFKLDCFSGVCEECDVDKAPAYKCPLENSNEDETACTWEEYSQDNAQ